MKKLMIVAAVAAMAVAAEADLCGRGVTPTPTPAKGTDVYQIQMQLRSTWGAPCRIADGKAGLCSRPGQPGTNTVLRVPQAWVVNMWGLNCTNQCDSFEKATWVAWEQNSRVQFDTLNFQAAFLNIFGAAGNLAETLWTFKGNLDYGKSVGIPGTYVGKWDLQLAGQGVFDNQIMKYVSFTGYVTGQIDACYYIGQDLCEAAKVFTCTTFSRTCCPAEAAPTAVYGRWAMRYNEDASKALYNGTFNEVPEYVTLPDVK